MIIIKWIMLLPAYWIVSGIVWLICSLLLNWFSTFGTVLYWLTVPEVFLIGGIIFPFAIIITILDELNLPIKPALTILFINNLLGILFALNHGGYEWGDTVGNFGIVFSIVSTIALFLLFFIKKPKDEKI